MSSSNRHLVGNGIVLTVAAALFTIWVVAHFFLDAPGLPALPRLIVGLLPALAVGAFVIAEVRLVRSLDELQQRIQLEALAVGYPTAILIVILIRFLQAEGFLVHWHLGDVWPLLPFPYFVGLFIARRRYGCTGDASPGET